jgi:hypothetical protein
MLLQTLAALVAAMLVGDVALTRGGAYVSRGAARTSVNRSVSADRNVDVSRNRNLNVNRNVDVDRNRDLNVDWDADVDVDHRYGGWGYGCCYHPAATAAAATAAAITTAAVIGSVVHSLPPSCEAISVNGLTYQQCGSTWYQPEFSGSTINYIVVNAPQ